LDPQGDSIHGTDCMHHTEGLNIYVVVLSAQDEAAEMCLRTQDVFKSPFLCSLSKPSDRRCKNIINSGDKFRNAAASVIDMHMLASSRRKCIYILALYIIDIILVYIQYDIII